MKEKNLKERMSERMNNSGDVAEQMMRMSLEGAEVAVKLTGTGALKLASIIYKVLQQQEKTKAKRVFPQCFVPENLSRFSR